MKHFMYGFDQKNPRACARDLKERGIDAVVDGSFSPAAAQAILDEGMELYLCYVAHSLKKTEDSGLLCQSPEGKEKRWFSSACPNEASIAQRRLDAVLEAAEKIPSLTGIFVDGARFASFASPEGFDSFFTCFCSRCIEKMRKMGLDAESIRAAVKRLQDHALLPDDEKHLRQWLLFREACVKEYMERFARSVRQKNPAWQTGAFIFAPSLGAFVGQTINACSSLDVISPMLYRAYPYAHGPACLNHEWAAFYSLLGDTAEQIKRLSSIQLHQNKTTIPDALLKEGFTPQEVGQEAAAAAAAAQPDQFIAPIIQLEDALCQETAQCTLAAGTGGVGYFAYQDGILPPKK
ncbi:MAG: hypothetical protein E7329_09785 [Clostridiales bacterium]|nr:hypothetical protein [Clostridiales bacterium]